MYSLSDLLLILNHQTTIFIPEIAIQHDFLLNVHAHRLSVCINNNYNLLCQEFQ